MEENWISTLPHGKDKQAISGYVYAGEAEEILSLWSEILEKAFIHAGTNFDLSQEVESIDKSKKLCIKYDFLHRLMLFYHHTKKHSGEKEINLKEFKTCIGWKN